VFPDSECRWTKESQPYYFNRMLLTLLSYFLGEEWSYVNANVYRTSLPTLTPRSRVLLEKLTSLQLVKEFPAFYGTRKFVTAFTTARQLSLSWASSIQSMPPHLTSWRSILRLSSPPCLGLPSGLFPSGFPTNTLYTPLLYPQTCYMPRPSHFSLFYHFSHSFKRRTILYHSYTRYFICWYCHCWSLND
jgi:hypothetical protein